MVFARRYGRYAAALLLMVGGSIGAETHERVPLTDMTGEIYLGFSGGLYPDGNEMSSHHASSGSAFASMIRPLDPEGHPSTDGAIVLVSIGMSNTTQEFCSRSGTSCTPWSFVGQALADPEVDHETLVLANGARGGQSAADWDSPAESNYDRVRDQVLHPSGLTEAQVQIGWVKVANPRPSISLPSADADAYQLVMQMGDIVRAMKIRYPNLRIVYLSSRIYAGYATTSLNPEPYAYESGFAVKWLIEAQIRQMQEDETEVFDSVAGDLDYHSIAPWLAWGPYLWASGAEPRSDGLIWLPEDFQADGTHPSRSGEEKVGSMLLTFLKEAPSSRLWFLADEKESPRPQRRRTVRRP